MSKPKRKAIDQLRSDRATIEALFLKYGESRMGLSESNYDFILRCFDRFIERQEALDATLKRQEAELQEAVEGFHRLQEVLNDVLNAKETRDLLESLRLEEKQRRLSVRVENLQETLRRPVFQAGFSAEHPPGDE